jgi:hypothetical protein
MSVNYKDYLIREQKSIMDPIAERVEKTWSYFEDKYGIKFFLHDDSPRPVNEWLDDLYLRFTPEQAGQIVQEIVAQGDNLFTFITKHRT